MENKLTLLENNYSAAQFSVCRRNLTLSFQPLAKIRAFKI